METNPEPTAVCVHCDRLIVHDPQDGWVDPEADGDDRIWRETCDQHDTFIADHEPVAIQPADGSLYHVDMNVLFGGDGIAVLYASEVESFLDWYDEINGGRTEVSQHMWDVITPFPAPELGTDEVIYAPDDDDYGYGPWVAMDDRSVGTRFPTESEALSYWSLAHSGVLLGPMTAQALAAVLATLGTRAGQ